MVQPEDREDGAAVDIILKGKRQMKRKYGAVDYLRKHYPPPEGSGEVEVEFLEGYDSIEGPDGSMGFGVFVPTEEKIYIADDLPGGEESMIETVAHEWKLASILQRRSIRRRGSGRLRQADCRRIFIRKGDQTMSNNNYDAFRTFVEGRFGFGGGQSMKKEGQKAPSIDDLKEAGSEEEFKARLKEGQAFRLKEKAGFHVISIDENRPPLVQVVGDSNLIAQMLAFAISEIIENSVKNGVPSEQAEGMFRIALELGIATSRN